MKRKLLLSLSIVCMLITSSCDKSSDSENDGPSNPEYKYQMYKEPYLLFGGSKTDIKSYEKRELISETSTSLGYKGENSKITLVAYLFENSKFKAVSCIIPITSSNEDLLIKFLGERYKIETDGYDIVFYNSSKTIGGVITIYQTNYYQVTYIRFPNSKSLNSLKMDVKLQNLGIENINEL